MTLPKKISKIYVPPLKTQGIKTKLVPFIGDAIEWNGKGKWIEPFLGSGVVLFNIQPERALVSDSNPHIIKLYKKIQSGDINASIVKDFLKDEGEKLLKTDGEYYYDVRKRFNENHSSLDFLFLNRSCFNGMMRFNKNGGFNVPFCKKPDRFRQAYITKISNQITNIQSIMKGKDWEFVNADWSVILERANVEDFVYLDPPYIGRSAGYFNSWEEDEAEELARQTQLMDCGWGLSMWKENKYRKNEHLLSWIGEERTKEHFYHLGSSEKLRSSMVEVLILKEGYATEINNIVKEKKLQLELF